MAFGSTLICVGFINFTNALFCLNTWHFIYYPSLVFLIVNALKNVFVYFVWSPLQFCTVMEYMTTIIKRNKCKNWKYILTFFYSRNCPGFNFRCVQIKTTRFLLRLYFQFFLFIYSNWSSMECVTSGKEKKNDDVCFFYFFNKEIANVCPSFHPYCMTDWFYIRWEKKRKKTPPRRSKNGNIACESNVLLLLLRRSCMYGQENGRDAYFPANLLPTQRSQRCQIILKDSFIFTPNKINNIRKSNRTTQSKGGCRVSSWPLFLKMYSPHKSQLVALLEGSFHKCNKMQ